MLGEIKNLVKKEASEADWKYHIIPVINYSKKLGKILNADEEITELAALLHDIGRLKFGGEDHHITGIPEAKNILEKYDYPKNIIDEVIHCVESHRGGGNVKPKTLIAKIIANADALAHFDILPVFFYHRADKQIFEEAFAWVEKKIDGSWQKLTLPEAKEMAKEKYKAIKLMLDSNKQYF